VAKKYVYYNYPTASSFTKSCPKPCAKVRYFYLSSPFNAIFFRKRMVIFFACQKFRK